MQETWRPGFDPWLGSSPGEGKGYPLQYSRASLVAQLVKNPPEMRRPGFDPWVGKMPCRRERLLTPVFWPGEFHGLYNPKSWMQLSLSVQQNTVILTLYLYGTLGGSYSKVSVCNAGDPGSIPGSGRSPGEGNGNPLQYSCLVNPMDREACQATVHGVYSPRGRKESDTTEQLYLLTLQFKTFSHK